MCKILVCSYNGVLRSLLFPDSSHPGGGARPPVSFPAKPLSLASYRRRRKWSRAIFSSKPSSAELSAPEEEWLKKLPDKKKPLYSHSLPCIESWLKKLGFNQSTTDRAVWFIERSDWHAQLSLDVTDLYIRKMEETRKVEEAKHAEEAALALVEREKAKCKAAIEEAQAAQRIAEIEAQKRLHAELKAKREAEEKVKALNALAHKDQRYRKYNIDEIELATEYFSESLKIGEGGYGPVYRASLDHTPVAIKVLRPDAAQGRKQFQQEVEVLSCIRHPNLVLLLGACPEYGCLVYEFMDNGSLEDRLFRRGNTPSIPWPVRFKIAAEIATALLFLHQAKPEPLVHRDLKPANILLDHNYTSKVSDVGLSRLVPPSVADSVTQYRMTSTAGTFCYIDPEYQQTGMLSTKSDIYSLGVLLLQIITAKGPMGLTHVVERALERGTLVDLLDPTVTNWPMEDVVRFTRLALKCSELRKKDRPDLGTVILPELNRLRNLGHEYQARCNSSTGSNGDGGSVAMHHRAKSACQIGLPTVEKLVV